MSETRDTLMWTYSDLLCQVKLVHNSYYCGYVRVPNEHPWFGISYNHPAPGDIPDISEWRIGEDLGHLDALLLGMACNTDEIIEVRQWPVYRVAVHGGLTYAGTLGEDSEWWFGFDTAHSDDTIDVWDMETTAKETMRMAKQLSEVMREMQ
jgi:hypothetical protein